LSGSFHVADPQAHRRAPVGAQHTAAILTTFNEIDMSAAMSCGRANKNGSRRSTGSAWASCRSSAIASIAPLRDMPSVNAEIRGDDVVYKDFVHLGSPSCTPRGSSCRWCARPISASWPSSRRRSRGSPVWRADGKLLPDDFDGRHVPPISETGASTARSLSTPILNPRSRASSACTRSRSAGGVNDQIVVRPMMYVALSYDHAWMDGEQAVTFLVRVKERLEDPARLVLDV